MSDALQPNPFLQVSNRDVETTEGLQLTLVNPAFMTRMISEIAQEQGYKEGDIRGGIRVTFPISKPKVGALIVSHFILLCVGILLLAGFGNQIVKLTETLKKQGQTPIYLCYSFLLILHLSGTLRAGG